MRLRFARSAASRAEKPGKKKKASPDAIYQALSAHGMLGSVVVYADQGELHRLQKLAPDVRVMPEADDSGSLKRGERLLRPKVVAFANRMASASSCASMIAATGPNVSSSNAGVSCRTSVNTVGG